jgi:hypothetical protein
MEHRSLDEITQVATVRPTPDPWTVIRRHRLNRLADLLGAYTGPIQLLTRIEYCPAADRSSVRADFSPLTLAYHDAQFRVEGLTGDTLGHAMPFFGLTHRQAHRLFCSCHYASADSQAIAERVRGMANRLSLRERWDRVVAFFARA